MKHQSICARGILLFCIGIVLLVGCQRTQPTDSSPDPSPPAAVSVPSDLQTTVTQLVSAVETFDIPHILDAYAEDFLSGSGRSREDIRRVFTQLRARNVKLEVEKAEIENVTEGNANLRTQIRLRYLDRFRDLGEGEVVITDVLRHTLRKGEPGWKIHADDRVSTYREGRYGPRSPNARLEVPSQLPTEAYTATITVPREPDTEYQVMVGNYAEDPAMLPPPDIVLPLPEDGVLAAPLLPNPQGRGEMVRVTVIAATPDGEWLGATTVSRFIPGAPREGKAQEQKRL